ncbi:MAG: M23 family metallopeptidase [Longimicrobiales bacterium]|nr:M23 family metallopeptidase [Longimicrobiales bacterium]
MVTISVLLFSACDSSPSAPIENEGEESAEDVAFLRTPIGGVLNRDIFYGALFDDDLATEGVLRDYQCLVKTRDGHRGTDILLPDFRAMDAGVAVLAPAPGRVIDVQDGLPDRNVTLDPERPGNGVVLEHPNGFVSIFLHLRRNSVAVEVGDEVATGDTLGFVGSSGNSNWPHLHFETGSLDAGEVRDPWEGPCGAEVSLWEDQLPYQIGFRLVDAGLTTASPGDRTTLLNRPPTVDSVAVTQDRLAFWTILHNPRNQLADFEVVGPDGEIPISNRVALQPSFSLNFTIVSFPVAGVLTTPGRWTVRFSVGEEVGVEFDLHLVADPGEPTSLSVREGNPGEAPAAAIQVDGWTASDGPSAGDRSLRIRIPMPRSPGSSR